MVQADADVLLIDEVLAVGDAAFQQKCMDVFYDLRGRGKTIVLVTHDMEMVQRFCHRAMLLEAGRVDSTGEPDAVSGRYLELNFAREGAGEAGPTYVSEGATLTDVWIEDARGARTDAVEQGAHFSLCASIDVHERVEDPEVGMTVHNDDGAVAFATNSRQLGKRETTLEPGERLRLRVSLDNHFKPGRWYVDCGLHAGPHRVVAFRWRAWEFVVYGNRPQAGLVEMDHTLDLERERVDAPPAGAAR
jgi:energy-coupling factor transporter ATP-binding protein EcfA2